MDQKPQSGKQPWVDPDDAPELTKEFFERAALYHGDKLIRPGRPKSPAPKRLTTLRLDPAVVEGFRATGPGWQTRMNDVLKNYLAAQHGRQRPRRAAGPRVMAVAKGTKQVAGPPVHPGAVLAEELKARALSLTQAAQKLRMRYKHLSEVVRGLQAIKPDTALRLERFLGTDSILLVNMQAEYDLAVAEREHGAQIAREVTAAAAPKTPKRRAKPTT
jgi:addiction module HigA family antidote